MLAGERVQTQKSFPAWGTQVSDRAAELTDAACVATRRDHLQEAGGAPARILLQGLAQEVEVRIGQLGARRGWLRKRPASSARRTVSGWRRSSAAMVPIFQCSA